MADTVLYDLAEGLATITLNRPDAMNALNIDTKVALRDALLQAAEDPAVRAVLLTGSGQRAFCVGQDLKEHIGLLAADRDGSGEGSLSARWRCTTTRSSPRSPECRSRGRRRQRRRGGRRGGLRLRRRLPDHRRHRLLQHLLRRSRADRRLGVSWTLQRLIGYGRAADLLLFPRGIDAQEALDLGIAHRVVPADELAAEAAAVARRLAEGPTAAYAALKESLAFAAGYTLTESLAMEDELQRRAGASDDHAIAVNAFVNKEKPRFTGR
ncbi:Enoyl-CoA hydratase OS=Streptomyces antimycoticus OX=68175 GN=SANT12839_061680 PE=3 SV=1 [Streptomyces antimycoticus]